MSLCIIGCGNLDRGDDAAGLLVARRLRNLGFERTGAEIVEQTGDILGLIDTWPRYEQVVIVDASAPNDVPGKIRVWNPSIEPLPKDSFHCSSHALGVREAVELARTMNCLPQRLSIVCIEGKQFTLGAPLSPEVERAVELVCQLIQGVIYGSSQMLPKQNETVFFPADSRISA